MVIKPKKQDFWDWGLHHYATKQPYNVVRHHIKTNTKKYITNATLLAHTN